MVWDSDHLASTKRHKRGELGAGFPPPRHGGRAVIPCPPLPCQSFLVGVC
jgi:hypothetical protein